jgi:trans-aconitate methyltransferase
VKIYDELAEWYPLLTPAREYVEEAAAYQRIMLDAAARPLQTMLELGSGAGHNASHLKRRFTMTLVEPSGGMLANSKRLNPDCEHVQGDMRTVRLGRQFDAVFVHDAVVYMTTEADVKAAIATAVLHCAPGGVVLFAPDHVRENFSPGTDHGGDDGTDGRGLRYLEWSWDPDPSDTTYTVDYAVMLRDRDGSIRVEHDRHLEGLFSRHDWLRWLAEAGLTAKRVEIEHSELEPGEYEVFVGMLIPNE